MDALPAFLLTALVIELTPGPNMAYLALISAVEGRRAGLAATAGVALGLALIGIGAALGLAALIAASPLTFAVLRWAGALYLLWLAYEAWQGTGEVSPGRTAPTHAAADHFRRGLVVNLLNPKAGLFYIAILPGFVDPEQAVAAQTAILTGAYVALATAIHLTIVALAGTLRPWLTEEARQRTARRIFATLLVAVAAWFLYSTRLA
ncbi:MAG: LysE family translocator [Parasphingopyxis sp.]|uniref:LysE family translocator n=1 Tax=Parasphingopyxis sp. TaxID=1920299 RepID=UPI002621EE2D|nr:LysE family translocator [uncultured Parasphingopyxis sp.]